MSLEGKLKARTQVKFIGVITKYKL